jgi:hypothetical protein
VIIIKFVMVAFLVAMTLLLVQRQGQGPLRGGPYFFLAMPGNRNPVKPNLRLNGWKAFHSKNVWRVWFDGQGHPVEMQLFRDSVKVRRIQLVYDKHGCVHMRRDQGF